MTTNELLKTRKHQPVLFWDAVYSQIAAEQPSVNLWIKESTPYAVEAFVRNFDPDAPQSQYVMPLNTDNGVFNFVYSVHWCARSLEDALNLKPLPIVVAYYPMPRESWFTLLLLYDDNDNLSMEVFPPHYFKQFAQRRTRQAERNLGEGILQQFSAPDLAAWLAEWDWEKNKKHRLPAFAGNDAPKQFSDILWNDLQCLDYYIVSDFLHFNQNVFSQHNPRALAYRNRLQIAGDADQIAKEWVSVWPHGVSFCEALGEGVMMHKTFVSMPMLQSDQIDALLPAIREVWRNAFLTYPKQYLPLYLLGDDDLKEVLREL